AYNNLVGGQDELVFDGGSLVLNERGEILARGRQFEEDMIVVDLDVESVFRQRLRDPRRGQQAKSTSEPVAEFPLSHQVRKRAPLELPEVEPLADVAEIY